MTTVEVRREGGDIIGVTRLSCSLLAAFAIYLFAALLATAMAAGEDASLDGTDTALVAELRLLGIGNESVRLTATLSFVRDIGVSGVVSESLALSLAKAGVPALVFAEARQALATIIDFDRDVGSGNRFYVRYRQGFSVEGASIGTPLLLWAELRTTGKGTITVHRFRPNGGPDRLWLANGGAAEPPSMRLPLDVINLSSGFGLRADPFDQPHRVAGTSRPENKAIPMGGSGGYGRVNLATPLGASLGLATNGSPTRPGQPQRRATSALFMHEGIDLAAPVGTPVYAAADGIVTGAGPNGGYGNWMQIDHPNKVTTVYGHLSEFAPDIAPGTRVSQGELIGFVGNTGRSTGAHLHFEVLADGRAVNPSEFPAIKRLQLSGANLERFHKQVEHSIEERDREAKVDAEIAEMRNK